MADENPKDDKKTTATSPSQGSDNTGDLNRPSSARSSSVSSFKETIREHTNTIAGYMSSHTGTVTDSVGTLTRNVSDSASTAAKLRSFEEDKKVIKAGSRDGIFGSGDPRD